MLHHEDKNFQTPPPPPPPPPFLSILKKLTPLYEGWEVPTMLLHLIEQGNVKLAKPITLTP